MRHWLWIILLFGSLTSFGQSYPTLSDLAKQYLKALKKQDLNEFRSTYTKDSILLENFSENLGFDFAYALERDFIRVLKEGQQIGIKWNQVKFVKVNFTISRDGPFLIAQPTEIIFQHRLFRYSIKMNCSKLKASWSFVPIARKRDIIELSPITHN